LAWYLNGKFVTADVNDAASKCPNIFTVIVGFEDPSSSPIKRQASSSPIRLAELRHSIASVTRIALERSSMTLPDPYKNIINITIYPPKLRNSTQSSAESEMTSVDALARLLAPTQADSGSALSSIFSENGLEYSGNAELATTVKIVESRSVPFAPVSFGVSLAAPIIAMISLLVIF